MKKNWKKESKKFRTEKVIKRRGNKLYARWKDSGHSCNSWIDKKDIEKLILYFIIGEADGRIKDRNGNKYLIFASTDKNKKVLTKYAKLWKKTKEYQNKKYLCQRIFSKLVWRSFLD